MKTQSNLLATAIAAALLAGAAYAVENAGGGQPTSTPTHTVPVKPTDQLTIKTKSTPPYAPPIEDERKLPNNPGSLGGMACKPGPRPPNLSCGSGMEWVDLDPSPKTCWACRPKPIPMD
jgi:hypothetical protein